MREKESVCVQERVCVCDREKIKSAFVKGRKKCVCVREKERDCVFV